MAIFPKENDYRAVLCKTNACLKRFSKLIDCSDRRPDAEHILPGVEGRKSFKDKGLCQGRLSTD